MKELQGVREMNRRVVECNRSDSLDCVVQPPPGSARHGMAWDR